MILVFEDTEKLVDDALIIGTELKLLRSRKDNFYTGLEQALSFAVFGFDGTALWHVYHEAFQADLIASYRRAVKEVISLHRLPLSYATLQKSPNDELLYCQDVISAFEIDGAHLAKLTRDGFSHQYWFRRVPFHRIEYLTSQGSRPEEIAEVETRQTVEASKKRRRALKTILGIPA
ncbi:MAG: hypothetical protein ACE5JU_12435 [Candidatus Binatia bacterium]